MSTEIIKIDEIDGRLGFTSASNAPADKRCEGRHQAQRGFPDIPSPDSDFGTQIHDALKTDDTSKLDHQQLSIYEGCVELREKLILERFGINAATATRIKEQRLWWKSGDGKIGHSGQVDLLVYVNSEGLIIEYKTLPGEVEDSQNNEQLRDQVALAAGTFALHEIDVAIVQPLVTYSPAICRYDEQSIVRSQVEMVERVQASNKPGAKRTAGPLQCKFCKARFTCKEYSEFTALAAPASMSSLTVPVSEWTLEQRSLFLERLPIAQKWLDECKSKLKEMVKQDVNSVPGWHLIPGDIRKTITNPNVLHERFLALGGTTEQFMQCVEIAKGKLEAKIREVTALKGKGLKTKLDEIQIGITSDKQCEGSLERIK